MPVTARREFPVWAKCTKCLDTFSPTLWCREIDGIWMCLLEGSQDTRYEGGELFHLHHDCMGVARLYNLPGPTIIETR